VDSIINRIEKKQFWKFHGGIHPPEQKFITENKPIRTLPLPKELILPLQQHIGQAGDLIVSVGDTVLKGQPLTTSNHPMAVPIHAPTSGTVTAIKNSIIAHPSGLQELCLFLTPDNKDTWQKRNICTNYTELSHLALLEKIANAGISGMGGAGFPTHIKANHQSSIEFLIINAAECEPYITADDLLIREHSPTIVDGINILTQLINPKYILIGIEENKPEAIKVLQHATKDNDKIKVCVIPTKYPSGGEKQLIQILTGKEIPSGFLPSSQGIVMQNIATCYAIADAVINDTPLIKRVTTVTGLGLNKPQNVWALLGTPVNYLLEQCEYQAQIKQKVIMGGPMMGFALPSGNVPVVKITNCILAPSDKEIASQNKEVECIRCGECADACPAQLLPQELQWSAKAKDHTQLETLNLFDCIECGACAYVCPSHIPLVHYYRIGKAEIREQKQLEIKAEKAKVRFEARKLRLERDKKAREEKQRKASEARKAKMNAGTAQANSEKSAVAAALARVKAKKAQTSSAPATTEIPAEANQAKNPQIAAAIARAKAKKLANQKAAQTDSTPSSKATTVDNTQTIESTLPVKNTQTTENKTEDKKAKVAAAIAKAKAKKLAQQAATNTEATVNTEKNKEPEVTKADPPVKSTLESTAKTSTKKEGENTASNSTVDDKKAKIAAAIAKAKAKKLAQQAATNTETTVNTEINKDSETTKTESENTTSNTTTDDKKAKIAAAVAKARAKKENKEQTADTNTTPEEDKKKRIAAAVAKAKAKKQQRSELN